MDSFFFFLDFCPCHLIVKLLCSRLSVSRHVAERIEVVCFSLILLGVSFFLSIVCMTTVVEADGRMDPLIGEMPS